MSYGLQIYNQSGFLQIDDQYPQFVVVASGTASEGVDVYFPTQSSPPLIMLRPTNPGVFIGGIHPLWTDHFRATGSGTGDTFQYKILKSVNELSEPSSGYGLVVRGSAGQVVFNSEQTDMFRVNTVVTFAPGGQTPVSVANNGGQIWSSFSSLRIISVTPVGEGNEWIYFYDGVAVRRDNESQVTLGNVSFAESVFTTQPFNVNVSGNVTLLIGTFT